MRSYLLGTPESKKSQGRKNLHEINCPSVPVLRRDPWLTFVGRQARAKGQFDEGLDPKFIRKWLMFDGGKIIIDL